MIVAVVTLSLLSGALGVGMVLAVRYAIDANKAAQNSADLYAAQLNVKHDLETDIRELTGKLAATDEQLREAKIRLAETERQRNEALDKAREQIRKEIRSAPNAVEALSKVLAAGPGGIVQQPAKAEASAAAAKADAGGGGASSLLITDLR